MLAAFHCLDAYVPPALADNLVTERTAQRLDETPSADLWVPPWTHSVSEKS